MAARDNPVPSEAARMQDWSEPVKREDSTLLRAARFVDDGTETFKSPSLNNMKPFYNGVRLDSRMAEIRKSIQYIRQNWAQYDQFMEGLKELLMGDDGNLSIESLPTKALAEQVLSTYRNWQTKETLHTHRPGYEAIKLFTSDEGQDKMYRIGYNIFRNEDSVAVTDMIRRVVFLVELINIDLFNLCLHVPQKSDFQGVVYRGLCLTEQDHDAFVSLRKQPISKRNIAIPLGLLSSSKSLTVAEQFIRTTFNKKKKRGQADGLKSFIMRTHVISLKPEYVDYYHRTFTSNQLSTICAVDISDISVFPDEEEVLLRGPFFQVIDLLREKHNVPGEECYVLETVMLNTNRDHISTSLLGEQEAPARTLFATMVTVTRSEFAVKYCEERGLVDDAEEYRTILNDNLAKLEKLMNA